MARKRNDRSGAHADPPKTGLRGGEAARKSRARALRDTTDDGASPHRPGSSAGNTSRDRARSRAVPGKEVAAVRRYRVVLERDESRAWIATVPELPGCHTYGRSLVEAKRRIC